MLAVLIGSEKEVRFAEQIRAEKLAAIAAEQTALLERVARLESPESNASPERRTLLIAASRAQYAEIERNLGTLEQADNARFWIDRRTKNARELVREQQMRIGPTVMHNDYERMAKQLGL